LGTALFAKSAAWGEIGPRLRRPCDVLSRRVSGVFIEKESSSHVARGCAPPSRATLRPRRGTLSRTSQCLTKEALDLRARGFELSPSLDKHGAGSCCASEKQRDGQALPVRQGLLAGQGEPRHASGGVPGGRAHPRRADERGLQLLVLQCGRASRRSTDTGPTLPPSGPSQAPVAGAHWRAPLAFFSAETSGQLEAAMCGGGTARLLGSRRRLRQYHLGPEPAWLPERYLGWPR
jgi:hypothetical protein